MQVNLPVWGYYAEGFIDPLYVPYVKSGDRGAGPRGGTAGGAEAGATGKCGEVNLFKAATWGAAGERGQISTDPARPTTIGTMCDGGTTDPRLTRAGWGVRFQRQHPETDPCPEGWKEAADGYCVEDTPEFDTAYGLYSKHAFVPKYQHFEGYGAKPRHIVAAGGGRVRPRESDAFDQRSVSPFTGDYVTYFRGHPPADAGRYVRAPAARSLI
jgi:hypothetical protein